MVRKNEVKTKDLTILYKHVPVSVAISDNITNETIFLCDDDPDFLIEKFVTSIETKRKEILSHVRKVCPRPIDFDLLENRRQWIQWENQVPVLGFNCSSYDLHLIKKKLLEKLADLSECGIKIAKKDDKYFYINTNEFLFLDVMNYLAPGTSYAKWVNSHGCKDSKLIFPYEWLDDFNKLYEGPPGIEDFHSSLKGEVKQEEYDWFLQEYESRNCKCMGDWLRLYNIADVEPFVEALNKERCKYYPYDIDMLKDAKSVSRISKIYVLNESLKLCDEIYSPGCKFRKGERYEESIAPYRLLQKGMVGGP